jgi:type IV pilus assembly protein PilW
MRPRTTTPSIARRHAGGFSLVELMVSMALSLMLLGGVVAVFMSSRASYEATDRLSRIQENGRFALDEIARDVRSAGFVGCARAPTYLSTSLNSNTNVLWDFLDGAVRGFQFSSASTWAPVLDTTVVTSAADGSDVLALRIPKREATPLRLQADMTSGTDDITVPNTTTSGLSTGDIALAYSCEAQAFFYVSSFAGGVITHAQTTGIVPGNANNNVNYAFRTNAEVIPVQTVIYYVRQSSAAAAGVGPADATSLWRKVGSAAPEELVEGVQQMQLQFGVDTNGDAVVDNYVTANAVTSWAQVYSVSVALLVRSLEEYDTDRDLKTTGYQLLDVNVPAAGDRRLRGVFTTTANIRNRVPVN